MPLGEFFMKESYYFDGHVHFPLEGAKIGAMLNTAIERGVDGVCHVDYNGLKRQDAFFENRDLEGNRLLDENEFDIQRINGTQVRVSSKRGSIDILKSQEVKSRDGHILAWGIKKAVEPGRSAMKTIENILIQDGVPVLAHPFGYCGVGREILSYITAMCGREIAVEENGQFPVTGLYGQANFNAMVFAGNHGISCFANSDIHGRYNLEYLKVGDLLHNSLLCVDRDRLKKSLAAIMAGYGKIDHVGNTNSFVDVILWNLESVRQNGWSKVADALKGVILSK